MMLSAALVFVILLAEIDLAAGVTAGVAMAIFIVLVKSAAWPWIPAMIVAFIAGMLIGAFIGFMVAKIGVPSFVVTLAFTKPSVIPSIWNCLWCVKDLHVGCRNVMSVF